MRDGMAGLDKWLTTEPEDNSFEGYLYEFYERYIVEEEEIVDGMSLYHAADGMIYADLPKPIDDILKEYEELTWCEMDDCDDDWDCLDDDYDDIYDCEEEEDETEQC